MLLLYKGSLQYTLGNQYQKGRRKAGIVAGSSGNEAVWCVMRGSKFCREHQTTTRDYRVFLISLCVHVSPAVHESWIQAYIRSLCSSGITLVHVPRSRPSVSIPCGGHRRWGRVKRGKSYVQLRFFLPFFFFSNNTMLEIYYRTECFPN